MNISFLSLIIFIISTLIYFNVLKKKLTIDFYDNPELQKKYYDNRNYSITIYIIIVIVSQILLNVFYIFQKCKSSYSSNIIYAVIFTLIPWTFIFIPLVASLIFFPSFKTAFSDVVGYFFISIGSNNAHDLLNELLDIDNKTKQDIESTIMDSKQKEEMIKLSETIIKICGNKGILINLFNPVNFSDLWNLLTPIIKKKYLQDTELKQKKQQELLSLVETKDNIGEALWYLYSAVLISSITYYNIAKQGCIKSPNEQIDEYNNYLKEKEEIEEKINNNNVDYYDLDGNVEYNISDV